MARWLIVVACTVGAVGCTTYRHPLQMRASFDTVGRAAASSAADGDWISARRLARGQARMQPDDEALQELLARTPPATEALFDHPRLGVNYGLREPTPRPTWERVLLYLPDRILDLLDVFSFDVGVGPGLFVDVHLTGDVAFGVGARNVLGVGWHEGRSLGVRVLTEGEARLPFLGPARVFGFHFGTTTGHVGSGKIEGFAGPSHPLYQDYRDYWSVGAGVHALLVGASVDVHLMELVDFLGGWVTWDPLNDDLSGGPTPRLSEDDVMSLHTLYHARIDERSMNEYRSWLEEQEEAEEEDDDG